MDGSGQINSLWLEFDKVKENHSELKEDFSVYRAVAQQEAIAMNKDILFIRNTVSEMSGCLKEISDRGIEQRTKDNIKLGAWKFLGKNWFRVPLFIGVTFTFAFSPSLLEIIPRLGH